MKRLSLLLGAVIATASVLQSAPVPPPERLLPHDTLAMMTTPEYAAACKVYEGTPAYHLWKDPAMKPFMDKLTAKFKKDVLEPLEKELGLKFADYSGLAQGQFTLAITAGEWQGTAQQLPGFLFLMDSRDKSDQLKKSLADIRKKWVDAGKTIKTAKIRDVEFTTLVINTDDIRATFDKVFPDPDAGWESISPTPNRGGKKNRPAPQNQKIEIIVGQSDSLLIVGSSTKEIDKIIALQRGSGVKPLAEVPTFQAEHGKLFRTATSYGWVNVKAIVDQATKSLDEAPAQPNNPMAADPKKVINALGLNGLKTAGFTYAEGKGGSHIQLHLGAPQDERKGLFTMFAPAPKDSSPPPFVPADAVKFSRYRLDFVNLWENLEKTLNEINPGLLGALSFFEGALKQQDPNFSLRRNLIQNLGDDLLTFEMKPKDTTVDAMTSAPALVLVASPNPAQLTATVKSLTGFASAMRPRGGRGAEAEPPKLKERQFQGVTIYSAPPMPQMNMQGQRVGERTLSFCASGGYVAISFDNALLEQFIRSGGTAGKSLKNTPGLAAAAEQVGGMSTGMFGMENQAETMRVLLGVLKKEGAKFGDLIAMTPFGKRLGFSDDSKAFQEWFDFTLLPPYDQISKYFGLTVYSGSATPDGLVLKAYTPYPPQFK